MKIDKTWPLSAAEQLKAQLRAAIRAGELRAGHSLPTVRQLASELALNPNTISAVYRDLAAEGLVTLHRRGGTRVAPNVYFISPAERHLQRLTDRLVRFAQNQQRSAGDVFRLLAARWVAADNGAFGEEGRYPVYDFLQRHEHDQA